MMDKNLLIEIKRMQQLAGIKPIDKDFIPDSTVKLYCENKISDKEFLDYLNKDFINENILLDFKANILDKISNSLNTFLLQAYSTGFAILSKLKTFVSWVIGGIGKFIKNLSKKYPFLFKLIIVTLIVFIIMIVFCSVAKAAATGTPIPKHELNIAIGILEDTKRVWVDTTDDMQRMKAIKILVDLRDGHINSMDQFGGEVKKVVEISIQKAHNIHANTDTVVHSNADDSFKESIFNTWQGLLEKGRSIVSATYSKAQSSGSFEETIKIVDKSGAEETMTRSGFSVTMGGN